MWQSTSTPFQDTTRRTTCSTSLPQSSRTEHTTSTALPPSTAQWKALGPFWERHWSEGWILFQTRSQSSLTDAQRRVSESGMLTVDRGILFYGCDRHAQIQKRAISHACNEDKRHQKAISEFKAGKRDAVSQHVLTSSVAGKEPEEFTLIILEREDKKGRKVIHAFATSIPVDVVCGFKRGEMTGAEAFVEQYRARWSIETGYRCIESMRPRTTSREESVRVLLLFTPIILFNAWILALHLLQRDNPGKAQTKMTFKMVLEFFMLLVREKTCRSLLVP